MSILPGAVAKMKAQHGGGAPLIRQKTLGTDIAGERRANLNLIRWQLAGVRRILEGFPGWWRSGRLELRHNYILSRFGEIPGAAESRQRMPTRAGKRLRDGAGLFGVRDYSLDAGNMA